MKSNLLPEFGDLQALLSRLTAESSNGCPTRTIFLVGSALVAPSEPGGPGVPRVAGMVRLVLDHLGDKPQERKELEDQLTNGTGDYQKAFNFLRERRGQDAVNLLVRKAVCQAYLKPLPERLDDRACEALERDLDGWSLPPAVEALGRIVARAPEPFGSMVLTTNFDPLLEVAIRRAGGLCYRTVLHDDGSIGQTVAEGCRVVHSHGYWYGSDTLHTPFQLNRRRSRLATSLRELLRNDCLLAVVGFGGWKDVFTSSLAEVLESTETLPDVIWAFHEDGEREIGRRYRSLFKMLQPGLGRGRLSLFRGIDAHTLFPELAERIGDAPSTPRSVPSRGLAILRQEYLSRLQLECNRTRLVGLDSTSADPEQGKNISLDHVYVSLDTRTPEALEKDQPPKAPISAIRAVWGARDGRVVLLGLPGSGKSTFLRVLALRLAKACASPGFDLAANLPGWEGEPLLPVLVPLAYLAQELNQHERWRIERCLERDVEERLNLKGFAVPLLRELDEKGGMVLFDGLDEVTDSNLRVAVREAIEGFAARHPRCRVLVTCRTYSYSAPQWQLAGWPVHELAPLDQPRINQFIEQWYREQQQVDPERSEFYANKARLLQEAVSPGDGRRLNEIATNPLLLTVMAVVHTHRGELPDARASVYKECVDLLLLHWQALRTPRTAPLNLVHALGVPTATLERALQEAAYKAHCGSDGDVCKDDGTIREDVLVATLFRHLRDANKVETFLEYCETSNGLLFLQGTTLLPEVSGDEPIKRYAFPHRTFQEYLAGLHLRRMPNLGKTLREHLDSGEQWREVIALLAEHSCFRDANTEEVENIIRHLVPKTPRRNVGEAYWRAVWLAGDLLTMLRRTLQGKAADEALDDRVVKLVVRLLGVSSLQPKERAAAARTLAVLGDPRPGVGNRRLRSGRVLPDIRWAPIPGGTLRMGAAPGEDWKTPAAENGIGKPYESEWGPKGKRFPVEILPFRLAVYPVTLEQFRLFKESDGYTNRDYWTETGWQWLQRLVGLGIRLTLAHDSERESNQPVTPLTWHEAVAFCNWITARYREEGLLDPGEVIRLPTEAEWEWAARGPEGRHWPWGNEWRDNACNSWQAQIGGFCAVGLFPSGLNWTGDVWDLAGNVLEWCSTKWVEKYETDWRERSGRDEWTPEYLEGKAVRTLRGGYHVGHDIYSRVSRGACRFFYPPTVVDQTLGYSLRLLRA
jgi:formylglycine-generating enzyme required for sulfatase activity